MDPLFKDFLVALGAQEEPFANRTKNVIFDGSTHFYYGFFTADVSNPSYK